MSADLCGYTVVDRDGIEGPCDLPATGWRWYQDVEHEDTLDAACDLHSNEGGRRIKALEDLVERQYAQFQELNACIDRQGEALEGVRDLANGWLLLSATAMSEESREWTGASGRSVRAVLERRMGADWLNGRGA